MGKQECCCPPQFNPLPDTCLTQAYRWEDGEFRWCSTNWPAYPGSETSDEYSGQTVHANYTGLKVYRVDGLGYSTSLGSLPASYSLSPAYTYDLRNQDGYCGDDYFVHVQKNSTESKIFKVDPSAGMVDTYTLNPTTDKWVQVNDSGIYSLTSGGAVVDHISGSTVKTGLATTFFSSSKTYGVNNAGDVAGLQYNSSTAKFSFGGSWDISNTGTQSFSRMVLTESKTLYGIFVDTAASSTPSLFMSAYPYSSFSTLVLTGFATTASAAYDLRVCACPDDGVMVTDNTHCKKITAGTLTASWTWSNPTGYDCRAMTTLSDGDVASIAFNASALRTGLVRINGATGAIDWHRLFQSATSGSDALYSAVPFRLNKHNGHLLCRNWFAILPPTAVKSTTIIT